jgi:ankyrin repeat protein
MIKNIKLLVLVGLLVVAASCSSPEKKLMKAIESKNLVEVEELIKTGSVDVNNLLPNNKYPIIMAIDANNYMLTELLINWGAFVDGYGDTIPVFHAVNQKDKRIIDVLLSNKAEINAINSENQNLLFSSKDGEFTKALIKKGLNVNQQDSLGNTPLIVAINNENIEVIQALLTNYKTSVHLKNVEGKSPFDLAKEKELTEIIDILKKADYYRKWPKKGDIVYFLNGSKRYKDGWIVKGRYDRINTSDKSEVRVVSLEGGDNGHAYVRINRAEFPGKDEIFRTREAGKKWMRRNGWVFREP